ncbi:penicillin-binding protein 1A [Aureimonas pseudogalii]|uniref:Penicillin-binding protein 1A n=1 Tax=Aureimonas pseudogalii TaxID=1744844 RepID=A0A7W6EC69_9HYPH|nr:PBP1A family penicillin-binding protein [Aureimonas pseudogalii]MBB3996582.1 penicillin-binding protein 1A [Aureimonas pseudogalii]
MPNLFDRKPSPRRSPTRLIEVDAWVDSTLWRAVHGFSSAWESLTVFSRRFRVRGFNRVVVELTCEAMTLGVAGFVLLLLLAQPAMQKTVNGLPEQADFSIQFLDRHGNEIGRRGILKANAVPIDELPDHFVKAVLATEDRRFFEHWGIDFLGLARAVGENARAGGVVQGGSTLTQQLAKNVFLSNERSLERKVNEAFLALWLESHLTKREILGMYLDRAYMGGGTNGAAAAAEFYFGKNIRDVSLAEGAMLAGLFKAPTQYAPHKNLPAARARANVVLSAMVDSGFMTEGQVVAARRHPAVAVDRSVIQSPDYFLDFAFEEVQRVAANLPQRTLVARTTVDMGLQKLADESVDFHLRQFGKSYGVEEGAMAVLDDDGGLVALVGGRDYGLSQFNRATRALRQPGSSFKAYVYAAAMENGHKPTDFVIDRPITVGNWSPQNYGNSFAGRIQIQDAMARSLNTVAVQLSQEKGVGPGRVAALAKSFGVETPLRGDKTIALGTNEVTVLDQATGYSVFPAGGLASHRHAIQQISGADGTVLWDANRDMPPRARVLSEEATKSMNEMFVRIPEVGTARRARLSMTRAGGKTGTTQGYRDAWFVGFTGNFTAAVWYGNDSFKPTNKLTGGGLPAMTWQRFMEAAHQGIELRPIPFIDDPIPAPGSIEVAKTEGDEGGPRIARPETVTASTQKILADIETMLAATQPIVAEKFAAAGAVSLVPPAAVTTRR